jgi:hypothetical protein
MQVRLRRAHFAVWLLLAILLPAILIAALAVKRNGPAEFAPVRLDR